VRLASALARTLAERTRHLAAIGTSLGHLDPTQVLARGYSIVRDGSGHVRHTSAGLAAGDLLDITFSEGAAEAAVRKSRPPSP